MSLTFITSLVFQNIPIIDGGDMIITLEPFLALFLFGSPYLRQEYCSLPPNKSPNLIF